MHLRNMACLLPELNDLVLRTWNLRRTGPTLRFMVEGVAAVCGAEFTVEVDGKPAPLWESFTVPPGASLTVGSVRACLPWRTLPHSSSN